MEQQIADLLRQNQDLIRALQIREDSHSHKVTVQFEKFDEENENFDSFIERFETYLDVQNVPIANRAKVFVSSLSAKLYQLLKNLLAPDIPSDQTLDKLKDALKKHLTPKPLIIPSRHKFLNRKQTEGEGISTYIAELRALAMNCDYDKDMLNIMLRDVFACFASKKANAKSVKQKQVALLNEVEDRKKGRVENEIDRLEKEGIIEKKVDSSEWATPVVPVVKSDGSIRLCADYSVTLNPNLIVPQHPLPRLDEIFGSLNGGKQFTKLDFKHAYLQMKVHPDSQKLMTINTHKGLYICKRLMYGLNGAPAIWQRYVDGLFQGRRFTLITDHKPLIAIFGSKRGLPVLAATRLLHYALILQSFEFDIIFRKTIEHGNADFLSRLPKTSEELEVKDDITIFQMSQIEALPVTSKELRQETSKDIELGPLLKALREDNDIEEAAKNCVDCARYKADPPKSKVHYWEYPSMPWERIHDELRRDNFEFRDRKFDVGDRVAVRVYRAANTRWKFGTIVKPGWRTPLHH
ncbi:uncharacterized protein K02A2.6 [Trichonephila clavipes]|nr:uncharacterized protein K02A2.6 [Trichonephila clavipes]